MKPQYLSHNCFVCGLENKTGLHMRFYETETEPVEVHVHYSVPAQYEGYPGVVHGGIVATMLDEVTSRTVFRGDPPRLVVTAKLSVRYRKPVPVETPLKLIGQVVQDRGKVITVVGTISGPGDELLAEGEATLVEVEPSFFGSSSLENENWRLYPGCQDEDEER